MVERSLSMREVRRSILRISTIPSGRCNRKHEAVLFFLLFFFWSGSRCRSIDEGDDERNTNVLFLHSASYTTVIAHDSNPPPPFLTGGVLRRSRKAPMSPSGGKNYPPRHPLSIQHHARWKASPSRNESVALPVRGQTKPSSPPFAVVVMNRETETTTTTLARLRLAGRAGLASH